MDEIRKTRLLQAVQVGLPLVSRPFQAVAVELGWSEEEVAEGLRWLLDAGVVRRVAGIVNHRKLGICANALVCWQVPGELVEEQASRICQFKQVSHCIQRDSAPEFPYNLYAMVHARDRGSSERMLARIQDAVGAFPSLVLWSTGEFKKSGLPVLSGREFEEAFPQQLIGEA